MKPQAGSRGYLVEIDTQIRRIRGRVQLKGDALKLQRLVWMCDANLSVVAELTAIIGSSIIQIIMERHKLVFALGYESSSTLNVPAVFVQMIVELMLELIVDSTAMWSEGEHGIPVTRYFVHVRSLFTLGFHIATCIVTGSYASATMKPSPSHFNEPHTD